MIFLVSLAPNITVVSSDRRFRQLVRVVICHLQSQSKFSTPAVGGIQIFVFNLVNQLSRDANGRLSVKSNVIGCEDCKM